MPLISCALTVPSYNLNNIHFVSESVFHFQIVLIKCFNLSKFIKLITSKQHHTNVDMTSNNIHDVSKVDVT